MWNNSFKVFVLDTLEIATWMFDLSKSNIHLYLFPVHENLRTLGYAYYLYVYDYVNSHVYIYHKMIFFIEI